MSISMAQNSKHSRCAVVD